MNKSSERLLTFFAEEGVEIELKDRRLAVRGEKNVTHENGGDFHVRERGYGSFARTMTLPDTADIEKITAEFDKGFLKITMPKIEPKDPSRKNKVSSR